MGARILVIVVGLACLAAAGQEQVGPPVPADEALSVELAAEPASSDTFQTATGAHLAILGELVPDLVVSTDVAETVLPAGTWTRASLDRYLHLAGFRVIDGVLVRAPEVVQVADTYGIGRDTIPGAKGVNVLRVGDHFVVNGSTEAVNAWVKGLHELQEVRARRIRVQILVSDEETGKAIGAALALNGTGSLALAFSGGLLGLAKAAAGSLSVSASPHETESVYGAVVDGCYTILSGHALTVAVQETRQVDSTIVSGQSGNVFQTQKQAFAAGYTLDLELEAGQPAMPWVGSLKLTDSRFIDSNLSTANTTYSSGILLGTGAEGAAFFQFSRTVDQASKSSLPLPILRWLADKKTSSVAVTVSVLVADASVLPAPAAPALRAALPAVAVPSSSAP